ncbi:AAA family ATPase [Desulfomicrobium sp. ZS1]|uniref:AAA family ATPase n=1 Tax=Desulfomicrobium sp. ZS1 TaxID=2952228 RepID=UPI0020B213C8|nr:AAA family ATPase [Desulfomicrobium sp. ZS1]UTF51799.1 AAA family ATPase [Desulfomicrobium sp. ZS1]
MKTGLTIGKFAPLHKGHQFLIEHALAETDYLIVIVYDSPEVTTIPLPVRAGWIRKLYPSVEVIEAWDGPTIVGDTPEIRKLHEDFLLSILAGRKVTHFFCSEFYGAHVSKALGAMDCRVDEGRVAIPISATTIRNALFENRHFVVPEVYRDLITKVVFLGAPSTGKTTLAESSAHNMGTVWMPEYGREYWEKHQQDRRLTLRQLLEIAQTHIQREDEKTLEANRVLFIDTDATTTWNFSIQYHGKADPRLTQLADSTLSRYDLFFLCDDDMPYDDTWDRSGSADRTIFQKQIRADLIRRRIPFFTLRGTLEERMRIVMQILKHFDKYSSLADNLISTR